MTDTDHQPLSVLILAPKPAAQVFGVTIFNKMLAQRLDGHVKSEFFLTGRRGGLAGRIFRSLVPLFDALRLALHLAHKSHDVYHLNPSFMPRSLWRDGLFLTVLRVFRKRKVVVLFHGWDPEYFRHVLQSAFLRSAFLFAYGQASRMLVLGSCFAEDLRALGFDPRRVGVISTMFDGNLFTGISRKRDADDVQIVFLGRFIAAKGIYELLEAFWRISQSHKSLSLVMAGHGDEVSRAQQWCAQRGLCDKVFFPGYVNGRDKANLLVNADIFALPSYHGEGCPIALLEAMGAGLPVVVTPAGGIPDVIKNDINGIVVKARDVDDLERALRRLIDHPSIRSEMAQQNRTDAWQKFEAGIVATSISSHYRTVTRVG